MKSKTKALTPEEKLSQALLPREEWPYELPKGWVWTRMEYVYQVNPKSKCEDEAEASFVPMEKISAGFNFEFQFDIKSWKDIKKGHPHFEENDVAFAKISPCFENRKSFIAHNLINGIGAGTTELVVLRQPLISSLYTYWLVNSERFISGGVNTYSGTVGQQRINMDYVRNYPVPLPPLPEQQRIVDKIESLFSKLDEAGDRLQKVLDGYEARRAAILHEAFSGKWTGDHGAGDKSVPKGWRKVKLSDVCTINPKKLNTTSLEDSLEVSFVPMASVDEVLGEVTKLEIRDLGKVKKGFTNFQEGDVVFAKITPCMENGKSAVIGPLLNDIGYGTTEFYVLRCHPELYNRFLYHLVRSIKFRSDAKSQMTGAVGQQRVPKNFMADYEILLPPLDEQIQIVQMVDTFFKKEYEVRKLSQNVIDQIDLMKKSILARAFRGELGTQDPSDPSALELLKECVMAGKEDSQS